MLTIYIKDLLIQAKHGVRPIEKTTAQPFLVSVELVSANEQAAVSDDLNDTLDYSKLRSAIVDIAKNNSFNLLERLAKEIADQLLQDRRIQKATIIIEKPEIFKDAVPGIRLEVTRRTTD